MRRYSPIAVANAISAICITKRMPARGMNHRHHLCRGMPPMAQMITHPQVGQTRLESPSPNRKARHATWRLTARHCSVDLPWYGP